MRPATLIFLLLATCSCFITCEGGSVGLNSSFNEVREKIKCRHASPNDVRRRRAFARIPEYPIIMTDHAQNLVLKTDLGDAVKPAAGFVDAVKPVAGFVDKVKPIAGFVGGAVSIGKLGVDVSCFFCKDPNKWWCKNICGRQHPPPPPDTTPPTFNLRTCPQNITINSEKNRRGASVWWKKPTATDGQSGVKRIYPEGYMNGSFFSSGHNYTISHIAVDNAGNAADGCKFHVRVNDIVCGRLDIGGTGYPDCGGNGLIYGTTCTVVCFPGHELTGDGSSTCDSNGEWSPSIGSCSRVQCPSLRAQEHSNLTCNDDNQKCSFECEDGYSIKRGKSDTLFCMITGSWSGTEPECEDTQDPHIECPQSIRTKVDGKLGYTVANWTIPEPSDNDGVPVSIENSPPNIGDHLTAGSYQVSYKATDRAGNTATCSFMIFVADVECDFSVLFSDYTQRVRCSDQNKLGSKCTFTCAPGYTMDGDNEVATLQCLERANSSSFWSQGTWNASKPTCSAVECEPFEAPLNGSLASPCRTYHGGLCRIECNEGFEIRGTSSRRCVDGVWDSEIPSCEARTCPPPYLPYQSHILNSETCHVTGTASVDTVCEYGCNDGHFLAGNDSLRCNENGRWFPSVPPTCNAVTCDGSEVHAPKNGYKSGCFNHVVAVGTTCTIGCNHGFVALPVRTLNVTCIADKDNPEKRGKWDNDPTLTCDPVKCVPFPSPKNGRISICREGDVLVNINSTQNYTSTCTAECNDGFTPRGTSTRSCMIHGDWDGRPLNCQDETPPKVQCPSPKVQVAEPLDNSVIMDFIWSPLGVVDVSPWNFSLKSINFQPVDPNNITTIFEEGVYTMHYAVLDRYGNEALCPFEYTVKVLRCPALNAPQHGAVELVKGYGTCNDAVRGSICRMTCDEGYHLANDHDENDFTCAVNAPDINKGYWIGSHLPCEPNVCNVPAVPNGYISGCLPPRVSYLSKCRFACNVGFQSGEAGSSGVRRTCQADGSWSGQDINCTAVTCPGGFQLENGDVTPLACTTDGELPYDTVCSFSCKSGYKHHGPFSKRCGRDGHWQGESRNTTCVDKEAPTFTTRCPLYIEVFGVTGGATVEYDVINATDNAGDNQVTISRSPPGIPENGGTFGEGYHIVSYTAQDREGNFAKCNVYISVVVLRCPVLSSPISGSVDCTDRTKGSTCEFSCYDGYEITGPSAILTCSGEGWTAVWDYAPPSCRPVQCLPLPDPPNAIKSGCRRRYFGDVCLWDCPYGYQPNGSPKWTCQANGTWSEDSFTCEEQTCTQLNLDSHFVVTPPGCGQNPVYEETCHVRCAQRGYHVFPRRHSYMRCRGNGRWTYEVNEIKCKDEEPPRLICPLHFIAYAERGEYSSIVSWNVSVEDNSDEEIHVECNRENDSSYPEGSYAVLCKARDAEGNLGSCTFDFYVRVRSCPPFILPTAGAFKQQCNSHYGSMCEIGCNEGYELHGSSTATCERENGIMVWKSEHVPRCAVSSCPPIPDNIIPPDVGVTPALCQDKKAPLYGLECRFYCKKYGFRPVGFLDPIICESDGTWNVDLQTISIHCEDFIQPEVYNCPSNIFATLSEGNTEVEVTFQEPHATDNSEIMPIVIRSPRDVTSPYRVSNTTTVTYKYCDSFNNTRSCSFRIEVQNDLPPEVVFCPEDFVIEATGRQTTVTWDEPVFSEPLGDSSALSQSCNYNSGQKLPWGSHNIVCTAVNVKNNRVARCFFTAEVRPRDCPSLEIPRNGALACDQWVYGHVCSQQCNERYDVPPGLYQPYFICGTSGRWTPSTVLDCSLRRNADRFHLSSTIQYYSGDCRDPETQQAIKEAFIVMLENQQHLSDICSGSSKCTTDHVSVQCGQTGRRRGKRYSRPKRWNNRGSRDSTNDLSYKDFLLRQTADEFMTEHQKQSQISILLRKRKDEIKRRRSIELPHRRRRSLEEFVITLSFDVVATLNVTEDTTDFEYENEAYDALDSLYFVADALEEEAWAGNLVPEVPDLDLNINENASFVFEEPVPTCEEGYGIVWSTYTCAACVAGTYFDKEYGDCLPCPLGEYQDTEAQIVCKICPPGTTTEYDSSQSVNECLEYCQPGEYSSTGLEPCAKCEVGFYQPLKQQESCNPCPPGHTTLTNGSSSIVQCIELCAPGYWSPDGFQPCQPCETRYFQPKSGQTACLPCPGTKTTYGEGASSEEDCSIDAQCDSNDCFNNAFCESFIDGPRCTCATGFTGDRCGTNIMDCQDTSCANGGKCVDLVNDYTCICKDGYQGDDCSEDINECASSPCIHAVSCVDLVADFACICMEGYTNKTCNEEIRPCESEPCLNGGTCQSVLSQFNCTCSPGYSGDYCEVDVPECQSNPCLNGGTCNDLPNGFECTCTNGYSGVMCEKDIDLCFPNPCSKSGLCVEEDDSYVCVCPAQKAGIHCERDATACDRQPCINGTCHEMETSDSETGLDYLCECDLGFAGTNCDIPVSKCESFPCSNNGTCENTIDGFVCHCASSFTGEHCEEVFNLCTEQPCGNNGICIQEETSFFCICAPEFTGEHCEDQLLLCQDDFCQNGGYCAPANSSDVCVCPRGFKGAACEKEINLCESQPCLNDGKCIQGNATFACQCQDGFTGDICDVNIDECWGEPCIHGECEDRVNDYSCDCFIGFEGKDCDININDCVDHACVHGECVDGNVTYACICEPGYRGRYCQEEIYECSLNPCRHSTNCIDLVNAYQCVCETGWTGDRCEINVNDCSPGICNNGGTCVDGLNDVMCLCLQGFSGKYCNENINECESNPCENGGTCHDGDDGYTCSCQRGWDGDHCQVRISMCQPNPCQYGGTCSTTDNSKGYTCECQPGLEGERCEEDIDDCVDNDCVGAATCIDLLNSYRCICPPGFTGDTCSDEADLCEAVPCLNNGTCNRKLGEDTEIPCLCPTGYEGQYCERNIDDCHSNPCLKEGVCIDGVNTFTCLCQEGVTGERCEEDIDECQNHSCDETGTLQCQDELDGYSCICRHGFMGRYCTERINSDFDIVFKRLCQNPYLSLRIPKRKLQNLTFSMWVRSQNQGGYILSYESETEEGLEEGFYLFIDELLKVQFIGTTIDTLYRTTITTPAYITGNRWHHIAVTYNGETSTVAVYVNGDRVVSRQLSQVFTFDEKDGIITLGKRTGPNNLDLRQYEGRISGFNVWDEVKTARDIATLAEWCHVEIPGSVLVLADFNAGVVGDISFEHPSSCEAFDDCANNPCANGATCVDGYQSFECLCPTGLLGPTCSENPDDCKENACLNGGTCIDGYDSFSCFCSPGYTGRLCELIIVHGGWGEWSEWSQCTKSCDGGNQTAQRECNSPLPQNGGADCGDLAHSIKMQECNTHECPRCKKFQGPKNGISYLTSDPQSSKEFKYQVHCMEGYDFCRYPLYEYVCGPDTDYLWNHEAGNPRLKVPGCTKRKNIRGIQVHMTGEYSGDICQNSDEKKQNIVATKINQVTTTNGQRQKCVRSGECRLSVKAERCLVKSRNTRRNRRAVEAPSAAVTMKFLKLVSDSTLEFLDNVSPDNVSSNLSATFEEAFSETMSDMADIVQDVVNNMQRGLFRISTDGELSDIELVDSYATFVCEEGLVWKVNSTTCVPCEPGTYQKEEQCIPCDFGTYQPEEGKTRCKVCPNEDAVEWTGLAAADSVECYPPSRFSS